jgi:zinc protease
MTQTATPSRAPGWTTGVRREVLSNGLTLLIKRDDSAPAVAVVTHVKAGFFDEPDRWAGISHVLEHMFFKGTAHRGVGAIARETKAAGGYLNASTSYDHTNYFVVLPASGLATALDLQADALRNSAIDPDELARELQVIIQEAKRKLDSAGAVTYETLHEVMFDQHRIRRWRIGYEADLARLTRDDLWSYYRSRYVPERTIVSIVGSVDEHEALDRARATYGDWAPAPGAVDPSPEEPVRRGVRARTLRGDVAQAELAVGWRAVPPLHPDSAPLDLAAAVLAAGRGSWLYRSLRETGLVTGVSAHHYSPTEVGVFSVTAELDPERLPRVLGEIAEAVGRLGRLGAAGEDVERARTLMLARWARRMESMEGRAAALAASEALGGIDILDREYAELIAVEPADVRHVAARYLTPDTVSAVAYLPEGRGAELTPETVARIFAVGEVAPVVPPVLTAPVPAAPRAAAGRSEAGVLHVPLPGVDLLVYRKPGVPMVTLGVYAPRVAVEAPEWAGLGALAVRSAVRGAGGLDAAALAFAFERLGGSLGVTVSADVVGFGATVLADRLADAAALLDTVVREPTLGAADVEAEREVMIAEAQQVADDMFRYPFQLAYGAAFGDTGYGLPSPGLPETLRAIPAGEVRDWQRESVGGTRATVIAVGDVVPEDAAEALAGIFGGWPARPPAAPPAPLAWALGDRVLERAVARAKAQSALAMVFRGPGRREPERRAAEVWAAVASGLGGRLFEALRDRRSLAYTVLATSWQRRRAGALVTYIATSPEREEEARAAMLHELARFAREPVEAEELSRAVHYLAGQAEVRRQSGAAVAGEILDAWLSGDGLGELLDPGAPYRRVTADDVLAVAARSLVPSRRAEGVVRGSGGGR